jgi:hypothetical protein
VFEGVEPAKPSASADDVEALKARLEKAEQFISELTKTATAEISEGQG